jgi:hypothetical protein
LPRSVVSDTKLEATGAVGAAIVSRGWRRWLGSLQAAAVATGDLLELHTLRTFYRVTHNFFHSSVSQRWQQRCFVAPRLTVFGHFCNSFVTVLRFELFFIIILFVSVSFTVSQRKVLRSVTL